MNKPKSYRVVRADRAASTVAQGDVVFDCWSHDYGVSNDDTRATGIAHVSVTLDEAGGYPFFTIPREDLEALPKVLS